MTSDMGLHYSGLSVNIFRVNTETGLRQKQNESPLKIQDQSMQRTHLHVYSKLLLLFFFFFFFFFFLH